MNTPPLVGGPLTTAAPPGTYFQWQMSATDYDGDEIVWSAAPGHTCTFLQIISQEYRSQSKAIAGGTAPLNFSGTCQIKFQACDRYGACGPWGGSYTWNPAPPPPAPATGTPTFLIRNRVIVSEGGRVTTGTLEANGSTGGYWGVVGSVSLRWDSTTTSPALQSRTANLTIQWTNTTACSLRFNGFIYGNGVVALKVLDFGSGFTTAPGQTNQVTVAVPSIGNLIQLGFEADGNFFNCK